MRITFVLSEVALSGGVKAVCEFANHLHKRGHTVHVIHPLFQFGPGVSWHNLRHAIGRAFESARRLRCGSRLDWFDLKANLIRVPTLAGRFLPDADVVVATWWETAYYVSMYGDRKGIKFYLAQHYEIMGGQEKKVNRSFQLGLRIIVNSGWLKRILQERLNVTPEAVILHAPDREHFYPEMQQRETGVVRILMPYRSARWKGSRDGIEAFEIARKRFPGIQLVMYGPEPRRHIPNNVEYHERPSHSKLRRIYNSCNIFIFPSWYEGFGMPALEAMACKLPVVTTKVGAVPEYAVPGETALVSEPRDVGALANNIIRLLGNEDERKKLAENGFDYTKGFTWERAADELEIVFKKYVRPGHEKPRRLY